MRSADVRHDWSHDEVEALFRLPFNDLLFRAQSVHRQHFEPNRVQLSTLLSIKTGACPEDCAYCPQSAHYKTGVEPQKLMDVGSVLEPYDPYEYSSIGREPSRTNGLNFQRLIASFAADCSSVASEGAGTTRARSFPSTVTTISFVTSRSFSST